MIVSTSTLCWLAKNGEGIWKFDLTMEEFHNLPLPSSILETNFNDQQLSIAEIHSQLALVCCTGLVNPSTCSIFIWDKVWARMSTIDFPEVEMVIFIMPDEKIIFEGDGQLWSYDQVSGSYLQFGVEGDDHDGIWLGGFKPAFGLMFN